MPFLIAGVAYVVAGGLLAAATAYVTTQKTAWATAYIVLVGGVAQVGLGAAIAWLAPRAPSRFAWESWACWNIGNAGVLAGQLAGILVLTDIGTVWLVVALILVLVAAGRWGREDVAGSGHASIRGATDGTGPHPHPGILWSFRGLVILLAITMPIGVVLAHVGA